jgi:hypothetical protein
VKARELLVLPPQVVVKSPISLSSNLSKWTTLTTKSYCMTHKKKDKEKGNDTVDLMV